MTLDEAIKHSEEVSSRKFNDNVHCIRCAEKHRQFAEWLKDYKRLKAQESILDKIRDEIEFKSRIVLKDTPNDDWAVKWNECIKEVLEIIDKYKAESEE